MKTIGADAAKKAAPAEKNGAQATFIASAKDAEPAKVEIDFSNVEVEPLFKDMVDFDTFSKSDFRAVKVKECEAVPEGTRSF